MKVKALAVAVVSSLLAFGEGAVYYIGGKAIGSKVTISIDTTLGKFTQLGSLYLGVDTEVEFTGYTGTNPVLILFGHDAAGQLYPLVSSVKDTTVTPNKWYLKCKNQACYDLFAGRQAAGEVAEVIAYVFDGDHLTETTTSGVTTINLTGGYEYCVASGYVQMTWQPFTVQANVLTVLGMRGWSAYEIAVKYGYTGTEEQWNARHDEEFRKQEGINEDGEEDPTASTYAESRWGVFRANEASRASTAAASEAARTSTFNAKESARQASTSTLVSQVRTAIANIPADLPAWNVINNAAANVGNAVHYTADSGKTDAQKEQARINIGAASRSDGLWREFAITATGQVQQTFDVYVDIPSDKRAYVEYEFDGVSFDTTDIKKTFRADYYRNTRQLSWFYVDPRYVNGSFYMNRSPSDADMIRFWFFSNTAPRLTTGTFRVRVSCVDNESVVSEDFVPVLLNMNHNAASSATKNVKKPLVLMHTSDQHTYLKGTETMLRLAERYSDYVDAIVNTGDLVGSYGTEAITAYAALSGVNKVLLTVGNHDSAKAGTPTDWTGCTAAECRAKFIDPFLSGWGLASGAIPDGVCYWYKDFAASNVRLIGLDVMHYDSAQDTWFASTLAGARTAGLTVLVAAHFVAGAYMGSTDRYNRCFTCNYNGIHSGGFVDESDLIGAYLGGTGAGDWVLANAIEKVNDFMVAGGEFAGWMVGHVHYDKIGYVSKYPRQLIYAVDTASSQQLTWVDGIPVFNNAQGGVGVSVDGTPTQNAFAVLSVDTQSKKVRIYKVGRQTDIDLRKHEAITLNYATGTVVCER